MPVTDLMRAAVYCRVPSPTGNTDDLLASLQGVAASHGWHVITSVADQPTGSASVRSARPALDALLRDTNFDVLAVKSLSHLASTLPGLIRILNALRSHGIDLLSCDDGIDTTTIAGKMAICTFAALATFERDQLRERARAGLERARRNGTKIGRPSHVNDGLRAAIVALHQRGVSVRGIARQLRVGNATIYSAIEAATVPTPTEASADLNNAFSPTSRIRGVARG